MPRRSAISVRFRGSPLLAKERGDEHERGRGRVVAGDLDRAPPPRTGPRAVQRRSSASLQQAQRMLNLPDAAPDLDREIAHAEGPRLVKQRVDPSDQRGDRVPSHAPSATWPLPPRWRSDGVRVDLGGGLCSLREPGRRLARQWGRRGAVGDCREHDVVPRGRCGAEEHAEDRGRPLVRDQELHHPGDRDVLGAAHEVGDLPVRQGADRASEGTCGGHRGWPFGGRQRPCRARKASCMALSIVPSTGCGSGTSRSQCAHHKRARRMSSFT